MINFGGGIIHSFFTDTRSKSTTRPIFGRVVEVVLDESSKYWDPYGRSQAINGVVYRPLSKNYSEDEEAELPFAYCGNPNLTQLPLKNEIVVIHNLPSEQRQLNPNAKKAYWVSVAALWNHPHHNAYPDAVQFPEQSDKCDFGDDFEEVKNDVAPLQTFPGDVLLSGRHGNTLRFGGTKHQYNTISDDSNNGKPFTILSNGMEAQSDGTTLSVENINEDPSSIYLLSDHTAALIPANEKYDAWTEAPEAADAYKGSQVLVNGGRLFFNAKDEGIYLSSKEFIGLHTKEVHIDGEDMVSMDAKKIYLGTTALNREDEPVLLGTTTQDFLTLLVDNLDTLLQTLSKPNAPPAYVAAAVATSSALLGSIKQLKNQIKLLVSKKVFTE